MMASDTVKFQSRVMVHNLPGLVSEFSTELRTCDYLQQRVSRLAIRVTVTDHEIYPA